MRICRAPDCENVAAIDRTLCTKHAQRWFKYKSFNLPMRIPKEPMSRRVCRVNGCVALTTESNKKGTLCEIHRYNKRRYGTWEKPKKIELPKNIVHFCHLHGELTEDKVSFNRKSPKGKVYLRCKECRREQSNKRLNDRYIITSNMLLKIPAC